MCRISGGAVRTNRPLGHPVVEESLGDCVADERRAACFGDWSGGVGVAWRSVRCRITHDRETKLVCRLLAVRGKVEATVELQELKPVAHLLRENERNHTVTVEQLLANIEQRVHPRCRHLVNPAQIDHQSLRTRIDRSRQLRRKCVNVTSIDHALHLNHGNQQTATARLPAQQTRFATGLVFRESATTTKALVNHDEQSARHTSRLPTSATRQTRLFCS
jgi:hypothetical protein